MSESPAPLPPPLPPVAKPNTKVWWFVWIFCTVILPGTAMTLGNMLPGGQGSAIVCGVAGLGTLILHAISSFKLSPGSSWMTFGFLVGGWVLMLICFFVGCVVLISQAR